MGKLQELAWVAWIGQAVGIFRCSLSGHQVLLIPDPNHCPRAASLECEEGGPTLVKCFVLRGSWELPGVWWVLWRVHAPFVEAAC